LEARVLLSGSSATGASSVSQPALDLSGSPQGLSPAMIKQAYDLNNIIYTVGGHSVTANGAGETIAIVDAYADPNITSDLQTFDANFGLSDDNAAGQFVLTVATPEGRVRDNSGWAAEESLDVEWAHAIAPEANILLVEASGATTDALTQAVTYAAAQPGVVAVSMSFGDSPEFAGENAYDVDFTTPGGHPGVTFVAASGDDGLPNYPSTSPNVLAVGGTTLTVDNSGNWISETVWSGSGGGVSPYEGTQKPDVAYDGDPNTGFLIYDSTPYQGVSGWQVIGGTSAGSPQWAGIIALVDEGRSLIGETSLDGVTQTIPDLYALPSSDFNPVSGGGLTGRGSPIGEKIISALVGGGITSSSAPGVASQLVFVQQPDGALVGTAINPAISVEIVDSSGSLVASDNSTVTLSVSGGGSPSGSLTATAVNGMATFSDVILNTPGTYTLTASDGSLATASSSSFTISGPYLAFTQQPSETTAGVAISPPIRVAVEAGGNVINTNSSLVTLSIATGPEGATLGGTVSVSAQNGVATFSNITLSLPGVYELKANEGVLAGIVSSGFAVVAPVLAFTEQPTKAIAGEAVSPTISIAIQSISGAVISSDDSTITLSIASGPAGGALGGALSVSAQAGLATFRNITFSVPGEYTLKASYGSLAGTFSAAIAVVATGWVDSADMNEITGWAVDPTNPSASINIQVVISGGATQAFSANETRTDLQPYVGSTNHGFTYSTPVLSAGTHVISIYAVEISGAKVLIGTRTVTSQNSLFDEHYYLATNPDVAAAVAKGEFATGYDHYIEFGQYEGRSPSPYWDESWYLQENPDVAAAVKAHTVSSGFMQYYLYGQYENRQGLLYFNSSYYLSLYPDVAAAVKAGTVTSAFEHYMLYGQYEGRSPMLYFSSAVYDAVNPDILPYVTGEPVTSNFAQFVDYGQYEGRIASDFYNEAVYLADNPDVAAAVKAGEFKDGFQQWLEYGQYEGRKAV
jgi:hypothetical protein